MRTDEPHDPLVEPRVIELTPTRSRLSRRWLLPIVVLVLGSAVFFVRLTVEDWRGIGPLVRAPQTNRRPVVAKRLPEVVPRVALVPEPAPLLIRPEAQALRPKSVVVAASRERARASDPVPLPDHANLASDLAEQEIYEEADRLHNEQAKLALMLAHQPEIERKRQASVRMERIRNAISEAEAQRPVFRAEMVAILNEHGRRSAGPLTELMARQNSKPLREVGDAVAVAMKSRKAPAVPWKKVTLYRSLGVPEPLILHELMRAECRKIKARNGPRNQREALVRAAEQLKAVPLRPRENPTRTSGHGVTALSQ